MRRFYIDNIRILCILLLFPFHTAMIFNSLGEKFYVHVADCLAASLLNISTYNWWMSGLFVLAGMSTMYALSYKGAKGYIKERCQKLLIPFLTGAILIIPVQTYIADIFWNGYKGNYFAHYAEYFKLTDWSGYDGHYTPGHTWFMLYLFVFAVVTFPLVVWYQKKEKKLTESKMRIGFVVLLCVLPLLLQPILDVGGKSISEFLAWYLLGFFIFSMDKVQDDLEKYRLVSAIIWLAVVITRCVVFTMDIQNIDWFWDISTVIHAISGIFTMIGMGKHYLNKKTAFTAYFAPAAFPLYLFHQSIVVIIGFFVVKSVTNSLPAFLIITLSSFVATVVLYEITKRFAVTRFLFGIKKPK